MGLRSVNSLHGLNGPEISKFLKQAYDELEDNIPLCINTDNMKVLMNWLKKLHDYLLKKADWTPTALNAFQSLIRDIWGQWENKTGIKPFPKLHMLYHAWEFAKNFGWLEQVSEKKIESYHYIFANKENNHHMNQARHNPERQRRSLADTTLIAIQPLVRCKSAPI